MLQRPPVVAPLLQVMAAGDAAVAVAAGAAGADVEGAARRRVGRTRVAEVE